MRKLLTRAHILVFAAASLACAASVSILAGAMPATLDVTLAGAHRLSDRTDRLLGQLEGPHELIAAINPGDRRISDRVFDVFQAAARQSDNLSLTRIELTEAAGRERFNDLVQRLVEREAGTISDANNAVEIGAQRAESVAQQLAAASASAAAEETARGDTARRGSTTLRALAREIETRATEAKAALTSADLVPDPAAPATRLAEGLTALAAQIEQLTPAVSDIQARAQLAAARDLAVTEAASLRAVPMPGVARVAAALRSGEAVLLVGPPDQPDAVAAISVDELFPDAALLARQGLSPGAEARRRAEDLLAAAVASVARDDEPILVLTHAEALPQAPRLGRFSALAERLRSKGIGVTVWHPVTTPEQPDLSTIDPTLERPVVYLFVAPDASEPTLRVPGGREVPAGAQRAETLAAAARGVINSGGTAILNLTPSVLPTYGDTDPLADLAAEFGIRPATGRPILEESASPTGRRVTGSVRTTGGASDHPLALATTNRALTLDWTTPLEVDAKTGAAPIITLDASERRWAESQWLALWRTPEDQRALLPGLPTFEPDLADARGPWTVAAAGLRPSTEGPAQRLVVIAAASWIADEVWQQGALVDGRAVLTTPGNIALLEASIDWLAGREELIARGTDTAAGPTIGEVDQRTLLWLRWGLIAGLPAGVLTLGLTLRLALG